MRLIENVKLCCDARVTGAAMPTGPWNPVPATVNVAIVRGDGATFCNLKSHARNCPNCTCPKSTDPEKDAPGPAVVPVHPGSTVSTGAGEERASRIRLTLLT